jgi:hypothetical protein
LAGAAPGSAALQEASAPFELYPGRPGAKYVDVEAAVGEAIRLGDAVEVTLTTPSVVPFADLPGGVGPIAPVENSALHEGFAPRMDAQATRFVAVTLAVGAASDEYGDIVRAFVEIECSLTAASDGAVAIAWRPTSALGDFGPPTTAEPTQPTTELFWFPIGERTGTFYVACAFQPHFDFLEGPERAVWSIDV